MNNLIINIKWLYGGIFFACNAKNSPKVSIIDCCFANLVSTTYNHVVAKVDVLTPNLFKIL